GTLMHAMIQIGDSFVMMSDEFPGGDTKTPASAGGTTFNLHVYSKDVDKLWNQAVAAGAKASMPLEDQFWGERYGKLQDPFGHIWPVAMVVKMSDAEKEAKRQAAFAMFETGEHPGFDDSNSAESSFIGIVSLHRPASPQALRDVHVRTMYHGRGCPHL